MAKNDSPKAGVDFEWVKGPGGSRMRRFFKTAEKTKRKESGNTSAVSSGSSSKKKAPSRSKTPSGSSGSTPRPKARPTKSSDSPRSKYRADTYESPRRGRSQGPGGPSTDKERAEAEAAKTGERPLGVSSESRRKRRAYDRMKEEGITMGSASDKKEDRGPTKRRPAPTRHPRSFNKGGSVKANCGASIPPKRAK